MPIHEFICDCGHEEEDLVPVGTKTIKCKECGNDMKKIISRSSFILKGSGWACDGYNTKKDKSIVRKGETNEKRLAS